MAWRLAEAKNRFSEVFTRAIEEGPQFVTRRNQGIVILSKEEYRRLRGERSRAGLHRTPAQHSQGR